MRNTYIEKSDNPKDQVISIMDLRDYFAGQALTLLGGRSWDKAKGDLELINTWAKAAYLIADSMLKERDK